MEIPADVPDYPVWAVEIWVQIPVSPGWGRFGASVISLPNFFFFSDLINLSKSSIFFPRRTTSKPVFFLQMNEFLNY